MRMWIRRARAPSATIAATATALAASAWCLHETSFITPPGNRRPDSRQEGSQVAPEQFQGAADNEFRRAGSKAASVGSRLPWLLGAAASVGGAAAAFQRFQEANAPSGGVGGSRGLARRRAIPGVDWTGTATGWNDIKEKSITDMEIDWLNVHGILTVLAASLFLFQCGRIASHSAPSIPEVWATTAVYLPWIYFCWRDTEKLENHYRVTFYASCGWAFMSLTSLHSVIYQDKYPDLAFGVLVLGNIVFASSCAYFYSYHWGRMWRHYQQNRFRPLWIPGLLGLMCLHGLTVWDFAKRVDDMGWWQTVCSIYPDEWWWVADVRIIELFVTAAALWLIILHIQGVFTGMKNAVFVVVGTIFTPLVVMVLESTWLRASAWQHYLMVGPKYF